MSLNCTTPHSCFISYETPRLQGIQNNFSIICPEVENTKVSNNNTKAHSPRIQTTIQCSTLIEVKFPLLTFRNLKILQWKFEEIDLFVQNGITSREVLEISTKRTQTARTWRSPFWNAVVSPYGITLSVAVLLQIFLVLSCLKQS